MWGKTTAAKRSKVSKTTIHFDVKENDLLNVKAIEQMIWLVKWIRNLNQRAQTRLRLSQILREIKMIEIVLFLRCFWNRTMQMSVFPISPKITTIIIRIVKLFNCAVSSAVLNEL